MLEALNPFREGKIHQIKSTDDSVQHELEVVSVRAMQYFTERSSDWLNREAQPWELQSNENVSGILHSISKEMPFALREGRVAAKHAPFLLMAWVDSVEMKEALETIGQHLTPEGEAEIRRNAKSAEMLFTVGSRNLLQGNFIAPTSERSAFEFRKIVRELDNMQELRQLGILSNIVFEISLKADEKAKSDPEKLIEEIRLIKQEIALQLRTDSIYETLATPSSTDEQKNGIKADSVKAIRILTTLNRLEEQLQSKVQQEKDRNHEADKLKNIRDQIGVKESAEKVEPWVDLKREAAYEEQILGGEQRSIRWKGDAEYLHDVLWFGMSMKDREIRIKFESKLKKEDFKYIKGKVVTSDSASRVTGKEIKRFVFIVEDDQVYDKLVSVFGVENSHGVFIPGSMFDYMPPWHETGALFSRNDAAVLDHEIRHSVDPYMGESTQRAGADRILEELFADWQRKISDEKNDWIGMEKFLLLYFEDHMGKNSSMSDKQYAVLVRSVINKAKALQRVYGDVEIQRKLVQCKKISDFMAL